MDHRAEMRKQALKELIKRLHAGGDLDRAKEEFKEAIQGATPDEIAAVEDALIREGMPREEIQRLCDVHLAVFKESLEKEKALAPAGHPIHILMTEHTLLQGFANDLKRLAAEIAAASGDAVEAQIAQAMEIVSQVRTSEPHYVREENVLFPYLEKHGITGPPAVMWTEHNQIRQIKKGLYELIDGRGGMSLQDFGRSLAATSASLAEMLSSHFYKENNILFPTALKVMSEEEWLEARRQFDELGYCAFTPAAATVPMPGMAKPKEAPIAPPQEGLIQLSTGSFSVEALEALLRTLPVDITFVDHEDRVRYFNETKERIFPRTVAVLGRSVQLCHPQKSLHVVNQILNDFRSGKRDSAEFWINFHGRMIHIRYFAVRNKAGAYLGCLEVTQDITEIQKLTGEKRLLS